MPISFTPSIQEEVNNITSHMLHFRSAPVTDYVDREILLVLAMIQLEERNLQWSVAMEIVRPFITSSTTKYYNSHAYFDTQLEILKNIQNTTEIIDLIYSDDEQFLPQITPELTSLLWLSGFIHHNTFIMPSHFSNCSVQAIVNFMSFVDEHYDYVADKNNQFPRLLSDIHEFKTDSYKSIIVPITNPKLFSVICSRLDPDTYSVRENCNVLLNLHLYALNTKQDTLSLLLTTFPKSSVMINVHKTLSIMVSIGLVPFDLKNPALIEQALESLDLKVNISNTEPLEAF